MLKKKNWSQLSWRHGNRSNECPTFVRNQNGMSKCPELVLRTCPNVQVGQAGQGLSIASGVFSIR